MFVPGILAQFDTFQLMYSYLYVLWIQCPKDNYSVRRPLQLCKLEAEINRGSLCRQYYVPKFLRQTSFLPKENISTYQRYKHLFVAMRALTYWVPLQILHSPRACQQAWIPQVEIPAVVTGWKIHLRRTMLLVHGKWVKLGNHTDTCFIQPQSLVEILRFSLNLA